MVAERVFKKEETVYVSRKEDSQEFLDVEGSLSDDGADTFYSPIKQAAAADAGSLGNNSQPQKEEVVVVVVRDGERTSHAGSLGNDSQPQQEEEEKGREGKRASNGSGRSNDSQPQEEEEEGKEDERVRRWPGVYTDAFTQVEAEENVAEVCCFFYMLGFCQRVGDGCETSC